MKSQEQATKQLRKAFTEAEKAGLSIFIYSGVPDGHIGVCSTDIWDKETALDYSRHATDPTVLPRCDAFSRVLNEQDAITNVCDNVEIFGL